MTILNILSWIAVVILSIGFWLQVWKIHLHKEVRDISLAYNVFLAIGFIILGFTAFFEQSIIFLAKQISTTIPVLVIIAQIIYHKNDHWRE